MKNQITKQNNGITLIALILTIIVLMILAVVAISAVDDGGIIGHVQDAKKEHTLAQEKEEILLAQSEWTLAKYSNNSGQTFKTFMESKLTGKATVTPNTDGTLIIKYTENEYKITEGGAIQGPLGSTGGEGGGSGESDATISLLEQYLFGDSPEGRTYVTDLSEDGQNYKANTDLGIAAGDIKGINMAATSNTEFTFYIEYEGAKYKFKTGVTEMPTNTIPSYGVVRINDWNVESRVGKYVEDENGDTWRIIYDDATHGLQMISTNTFQYNNADFYLGYNDTLITDWTSINTTTPEFGLADLNGNKSLDDNLEKSIYSYNQTVETLNTACENLFKENGSYTRTYIQDVRCVGSNPVFANKNSENTTTATSANYPALATFPNNNNNASQAAGIANGKGYGTDNNFESDFDRMVALGINGSDKDYWLASRVVGAGSGDVYFDVRCVNSDGSYSSYDLWNVAESGTGGYDFDNALRPVVSLSSSIQFAEGTDGSEGNPYKFN